MGIERNAVDEISPRRGRLVAITAERKVGGVGLTFVDQHLGGLQIDVGAIDAGGSLREPFIGLWFGNLAPSGASGTDTRLHPR